MHILRHYGYVKKTVRQSSFKGYFPWVGGELAWALVFELPKSMVFLKLFLDLARCDYDKIPAHERLLSSSIRTDAVLGWLESLKVYNIANVRTKARMPAGFCHNRN